MDPTSKPGTRRRKPRKRGAQPGNKNALKHGFYAAKFSQAEVASLGSLQEGLADEILMLRLLMRRVVDKTVAEDGSVDEWMDALQRLSLAANRLARMVKVHQELTHGDKDETTAFYAAVRQEMMKKGW